MMKSKEEIEGLGNLYLINETREKVEDDIPEVYTQDDIIKAVAWGYDEGFYDATQWHYPSKGEYPQNNKWVFVYLNDETCTVGLYCSYAQLKWIDNYENRIYAGDIVAWQYIVPPKEKVTIKCCENCGHYKNNVCERTKTHPNKPKEWTCLDWKEEA